ncbi:hypothetical protein NLG97_g5566 [Lecanicillium saksenae]|uniref:Uncharacterized protein n=1 Tax=Lecanicillium saksenae TaxID=468837 RepID=A0ACC1QS27_9HYPO|nr:hypothetical protein NLG97_g5566 [Lecanicillium saksenae]
MPKTPTDGYWSLPPISRALGTWMFVTSIGIHFGRIPFHWLRYNQFYLRFPPQIWRLATGCLITGPGLGIVFDTYFLCNAAIYLEKSHPQMRRKEDFIWYLISICCFIAVMECFIPGMPPFPILTEGFIIALTYTATQRQQGVQSKLMFIPFNFPAPLTPYAMILINLLMGGDIVLGIYGLVAGHLWEFLTRIYPEFGGGPNILKTPWFMTSLVRTGRQFFSSSGVTGGDGADSGPLPDSWRTKGRRLG